LNNSYLPLLIGSLPHTDPISGVEVVFQFFPDTPTWPQFPKYSSLESMELQYLDNIPGWYEQDGKVLFKKSDDVIVALSNYLEYAVNDRWDKFEICLNRAKGFYLFLEYLKKYNLKPSVLKGQVIGPITFLTSHVNEHKERLFKDEVYIEAIPLFLKQKALFQYNCFKKISPNSKVIIFFDEPILSEIGSAVTNISYDIAKNVLSRTFNNLPLLKGIHICGNSDWDFILKLPLDIVNFDAYNFYNEFLLYEDAIKLFVNSNKYIALGIIPTDKEELKKVTFNEIYELTRDIVNKIKDIVGNKDVDNNIMLTPSCGMGTLEIDESIKAFNFLKDLSMRL
jgi:methionine synthase II (cobalamin-independent)